MGFLGLVALVAVAGAVSLWGADISVLTNNSLADVSPRYAVTDLAFLLGLLATIPGTFSVIGRYRRGNGLERQQIKWLLVGASVFATTFALAPLLDDSYVWGLGIALCMAFFPVAVGIAVFRYRLYELGRIVSRTVSYAIVVAALGAIFALGVVFIPNQLMGVEDPPGVLVAASTLAAAGLFSPVRRWARGWIDRGI